MFGYHGVAMSLVIQPVTRDNWRAMLDLAVAPEQQRFVAGYAPVALVGLAKAYVQPGGRLWLPLAFYDGDRPLGFVMLAADADQPEAVWIYHFFIDQRYQGQGVGQAAAALLVAHITAAYPTAERVYLTVHPENRRGQRLYLSAGFRPAGETVDDEPVYVRPLP